MGDLPGRRSDCLKPLTFALGLHCWPGSSDETGSGRSSNSWSMISV
jgi:hypothetical protein